MDKLNSIYQPFTNYHKHHKQPHDTANKQMAYHHFLKKTFYHLLMMDIIKFYQSGLRNQIAKNRFEI